MLSWSSGSGGHSKDNKKTKIESWDLLSRQGINVEVAKVLAEYVSGSGVLTDLNLFDNKIGPEGGVAIGKALAVNEVLKTLRLGSNKIGDEGANQGDWQGARRAGQPRFARGRVCELQLHGVLALVAGSGGGGRGALDPCIQFARQPWGAARGRGTRGAGLATTRRTCAFTSKNVGGRCAPKYGSLVLRHQRRPLLVAQGRPAADSAGGTCRGR